MIEGTLIHLSYIKKSPYKGGYKGMSYQLAHEGDQLLATYYPYPWCFEKTPDSDKTSKTFEFSEAGIKAAVDWLNESYEAEKKRFQEAAAAISVIP